MAELAMARKDMGSATNGEQLDALYKTVHPQSRSTGTGFDELSACGLETVRCCFRSCFLIRSDRVFVVLSHSLVFSLPRAPPFLPDSRWVRSSCLEKSSRSHCCWRY